MPDISVIVPTLNERGNLLPLVTDLCSVLSGMDYEIMIVDDDSEDGTASYARQMAQRETRIRVIQRVGRRGLSSAVVEGMLASSSPVLAVIDADGQHDPSILPAMCETLKSKNLDLVIGSRACEGGSMGEFASERVALSRLGRGLSRAVCRAEVLDPMSGYFVVTRKYVEEVVHSLSCTGFKILLDLLASAERPVRFAEVAYRFRLRRQGESKLNVVVALEFFELLLDKLVGRWLPVRYVIFGCIGGLGVLISAAMLFALLRWAHLDFASAQAIDGAVVIGLNFALNNRLTFRAFRLRGRQLVAGFAIFFAGCSLGLLANLAIALALLRSGVPWYFAGLTGIIVGSLWNYWMSCLFVWKVAQHRRRVRQLASQSTAESAVSLQ
jgi:dolichol-phosphate mannosyltransferase